VRVLNTAIVKSCLFWQPGSENGGYHTAELEIIDLHEDELHAYNLTDDAHEVHVALDGILELKTASHLIDDDLFDDEEV